MFGKIIKYPLKYTRNQQILAVLAIFASVFSLTLLVQSLKPVEAKGEGAKIVTVFENGERFAFKTNATTVRDALNEQNIIISKEDNVEPNLDETLTDTDYSVNIYRAAPYVVVDGNSRTKVLSSAKTTRKIAENAGLIIFDEDLIKSETSQNPLEDGTTAILSVVRAKLITVKLFGRTEQIRTQADTIGEFLKEKKIKLTNQDGISKSENSKIIEGDSFEIWRNGKQTITVEEEIAFETEKIQDASKDSGYREVREQGENGKKTATYGIEMQNGVEVARNKITEVEIRAPKKQIEVIGTKVRVIVPSEHQTLMAQAGIPASDFESAEWLIAKESGWRINATNSSSGAYGLPQALPGSKMASAGADWQTNPVTQLKWMNDYVMGRYGSWANAVAHSKTKGWY